MKPASYTASISHFLLRMITAILPMPIQRVPGQYGHLASACDDVEFDTAFIDSKKVSTTCKRR
jgi:hypothetical protein